MTYSFRQSFSLYGMQVLLFENQCKCVWGGEACHGQATSMWPRVLVHTWPQHRGVGDGITALSLSLGSTVLPSDLPFCLVPQGQNPRVALLRMLLGLCHLRRASYRPGG